MRLSCPPELGDCLPCLDACVWSSIVIQKEDIIDWQNSVPSDCHLFGPMKKYLSGKRYANDEEVKTAVMRKWLKEQSKEFFRDRDTCSHSRVEHCYWEKQWQCWEVWMWSTFLYKIYVHILMYDTCLSVGNYSCAKEKGITFWLTLVEAACLPIYLFIIHA